MWTETYDEYSNNPAKYFERGTATIPDPRINYWKSLLTNAEEHLKEIASSLGTEIKSTEKLTINNFDFELSDPQIAQTLFSIPNGFDSAEVLEVDEGMIILSVNSVQASNLIAFDQVTEEAIDYVINDKTLELVLTLQNSLISEESPDLSRSYLSTLFGLYFIMFF